MRLTVYALTSTLLLTGCGPKPEAPPPAPSALVVTAPAQSAMLEDVVTLYGQAELNPGDSETLTAPVEARVAIIHVLAGQSVAKGELVASLQASPTAQLDADKAARDAMVAETDFQRLRRLQADGLAADNEVTTAKAAAETARTTSNSLHARAGQLQLRSGRAGVVDTLPVSVGDLLPAGGPVAKVGGLTALRARLGVDPTQIRRAAIGQTIRLSSLAPGQPPLPATILSIDRRVDPTTRMAGVLVALPAATGFLPGQPLKGDWVVGGRTAAVTVPREAVIYDGDNPAVFVAVKGKAERRPVTLGLDDGHRVEILTGLSAGALTVVQGGAILAPGMALRETAGQTRARP